MKALLVAVLASTAQAVEPLSEDRVVDTALRTHPAIVGAAATRGIALENSAAAHWSLLPDVRLSAGYTRLSSLPERYRSFEGLVFPQLLDMFSTRVTATIPITELFLNLAAAARSAGKASQAAALELVTARAQVAYEARVALYEFWSRRLAVDAARELVRAAEENLSHERARAEAGAAAPNDVLSFASALDEAVISLETARGDLATAEATLRLYVPDLGDAPALPAQLDAMQLADVADDASSPQLRALQLQVEAADAAADSVSLSRLPTLRASASGILGAPNPRVVFATELLAVPTWELGVQLDWSLEQLTAGTARTARARHEATVMRARLAEATQKLASERTATRALYDAALARSAHTRARVDNATKLAEARRGEQRAGSALALAVVTAEVDLARARNEHVAAAIARALAIARLDFLAGRSAPDTLTRGIR